MTLEVLFPDLSNLYGEIINARYLASCLPDAEVIYTENREVPQFVNRKVDMITIGFMTENKQELAIKRLQPYVSRIRELIEEGTVILATGNAMELFGEYIEEDGRKIEALGIFPFHSIRHMDDRHNSHFLGEFEGMKIIGERSQFSTCHGEFSYPFIKVIGGRGNCDGDPYEGIHYRNFFATYLLGPFLVKNPLFTKYLLRLLGEKDTLVFEKEAMEAYELLLAQMEDPEHQFILEKQG